MKIQLKKDINMPFEEIEVSEHTTIEHIYFHYKDELKYTVLAAKVNNKVVSLTKEVEEDAKVEFLDMRSQHANLAYQYGLSLVYVKAVWDILGDVNVDIKNSLNKGLYTEIESENVIDEKTIEQIEKRMKEIVKQDITIKEVSVDTKKAFDFLQEHGLIRNERRFLNRRKTTKMMLSELDGYYDFFYDIMVPSTSYVDKFELVKYKDGILLRFPHQTDPSTIPAYVDEVNLYKAFSETAKWQQLLDIQYVSDLNEKIEEGKMREVIQLSEALHEKKVIELAEEITQKNKRIILIAGPSSSGKTTFARRLCVQLQVNGLKPLYLGTDDYYLERDESPVDKNGNKDFENINALDINLFNSQMNDLLSGKEVDIPVFDFLKGEKVFGTRKTKIDKDDPIVIEGLFTHHDELTEQIPVKEKFKIYISPLTGLNIDRHNRIPTTDERMLRRIVRDYKYRNKTAAETIKDWPIVRRGEDKNIFPYSNEADAFFNSVHIYEGAVLKRYARPLLEEVMPEEEEYAEARRMLRFLEFWEEFSDDHMIVNNSILREFIGGSIFVDI